MAISAKSIIPIVVALVIIGALLSIALEPLIAIGDYNVTINSVETPMSEAYPTLTTMIGVLIPILAVIGIALLFLNTGKD